MAVSEYCFVKDTLFNELENSHDPNMDSALHQNVTLVLIGLSYNTRNARGQNTSAHDVFCKEHLKEAVRFMSNVLSPEAHNDTVFSDLVFFRYNKSLHRQIEMVENIETGAQKLRHKPSHVFAIENQVLIYRKDSKVKKLDRRRRDLFLASMPETLFHFWKKGLKRASLLKMADRKLVGKISSKRPGTAA